MRIPAGQRFRALATATTLLVAVVTLAAMVLRLSQIWAGYA